MANNGKRNMRLLAAGTLLAGTALLAGGFLRMEGSKGKAYPQQAERGYSTLLLYLDGSDLESSYGAAGDDLEEIGKAVAQADPEGRDIHIVVEAGGASQWQYSQMEDCSYGRFHEAFDRLVSILPAQDADSERMYQELGRLRGQIQGFGQQGAESMPEQVDVMDFLWHLLEAAFPKTFQELDMAGAQEASQESGQAGQVSGEDLQELYQELRDAYGQMIIKKSCSGYTQEPSGMNLYLPSGDNSQIRTDGRIYQALPFCEKYQAFTENYIKYLTAGGEIPWQEPLQEDGEVKAEIPPSQQDEIANAYGAVSVSQDGCTYLISTDGDTVLDQSGYLKAPMEDTFWGLKGQILCLIENYTRDGETEYTAPILYKKEGSGWAKCNMRIRFSEDCPDGEVVQIEPYEISKQVYALEAGDALIPLYPLFGQEGGNGAEGIGLEEK